MNPMDLFSRVTGKSALRYFAVFVIVVAVTSIALTSTLYSASSQTKSSTNTAIPVISRNLSDPITAIAGGTKVVNSAATSPTAPISIASNITPTSSSVAEEAATPADAPIAGVIIPLYTQPSDSSWSQVVATKEANPSVPMIAIVNPASGPGDGPSSQWANGIDQLRSVGVKVVGYVASGYGAEPLTAAESQIQDYSKWYHVDGIFFDEMANNNGSGSCPSSCTLQQYYQDLVSYSSSVGYNLTIGNPGSATLPSYEGIMSILVIYENSGLAPLNTLQASTADPANRNSYASISIGVGLNSTQEISSAKYVAWIYMTDICTGQSVSACNPYDGLPSYFSSLVSNLNGMKTVVVPNERWMRL